MALELPAKYIDFEQPLSTRPPRIDSYDIRSFTEQSNLDSARLSWLIHAEGYEAMGFVKHAAVTSEGYLSDTIDKARGSLVDYYIATRESDISGEVVVDAATVRKINLPRGGTVKDLPAYKLCRENLYDEERDYLLTIENADFRVKELGALARTQQSSPASVFELLRNVCHEAQRKQEVWFFSIVSTTYGALVNNFGKSAIRQVGTPVAIDDRRVSDGITLVPVVADVDAFVGEIYNSALKTTNRKEKQMYMRSFLFFAEGLRDDELGEDLVRARTILLEQLKQL